MESGIGRVRINMKTIKNGRRTSQSLLVLHSPLRPFFFLTHYRTVPRQLNRRTVAVGFFVTRFLETHKKNEIEVAQRQAHNVSCTVSQGSMLYHGQLLCNVSMPR